MIRTFDFKSILRSLILNTTLIQCSLKKKKSIEVMNIQWYINSNLLLFFSHHMPVLGEGVAGNAAWQYASWLGEDGSLLLAADNEVLARPGPPARRAPLLRLTSDSIPGRVYNGVSDWLYQGIHC